MATHTAGSRAEHGGGKQNWSFSQLMEFAGGNHWKGYGLTNYVDSQLNDNQHNTDDRGHGESLGLNGTRLVHIRPAGLLSTLLWIKNPLFREAPVNLALGLLREFATEFQEGLDVRLSGGPYMRKKKRIQEWIGALTSERGILESHAAAIDFAHTVPDILGLQIVWVREEARSIGDSNDCETATDKTIFFSTHPGHWKSSIPTYVASLDGTWILEALADSGGGGGIDLYEWVMRKSLDGWTTEYHSTDPNLTKVQIVERLETTVFGGDIDKSLKKDALAKKLVTLETTMGLRRAVYGA